MSAVRLYLIQTGRKEKAMRELRRIKRLKPCSNTGAQYTTARARIFA